MTKLVKFLGVGLLIVGVAAGGFYLWAKSAAATRLSKHFDTHRVDFAVPFPLSVAEVEELRAAAGPGAKQGDAELAAKALERAIDRGKHLVESRYACAECHGRDFGGGTMVDDGAIGHLFGVNLTSGKGGQVNGFTVVDWDRIVRHGVRKDGAIAAMPSSDFFFMSDRELSDIIAYVRSVKPVDKEVPRPVFGPVGNILIGLSKMPLSAEELPDHHAAHAVEAPIAGVTPEFGKHLVAVCTGCHNPSLTGGKITAGPPDWPPARNLTPHEQGLAGWTYEDFARALREGKSKNGAPIKAPMSLMTKMAANVTELEMKAMWAYLQSLPPKPSPN